MVFRTSLLVKVAKKDATVKETATRTATRLENLGHAHQADRQISNIDAGYSGSTIAETILVHMNSANYE
jgi:hypothetical protein